MTRQPVPPGAASCPGSTSLYCATLLAFFLGFLATSLGVSYLDSGWLRDGAVSSGAVLVGWGAWRGLDEVRRLVRRRRLREHLRPVLQDRARYLSGHPAFPHPRRLSVLLTADALLLDDDRRILRVPLVALRQAQPPDPSTGRGRPWPVARNEYATPQEPGGRLTVEFLDDGATPRRIALTRFQRTRPADWDAAISRQLSALGYRPPDPPPFLGAPRPSGVGKLNTDG